ncbi:MAG: ankyrin repeat domain-containing protein [Waddliaceae bacterium]
MSVSSSSNAQSCHLGSLGNPVQYPAEGRESHRPADRAVQTIARNALDVDKQIEDNRLGMALSTSRLSEPGDMTFLSRGRDKVVPESSIKEEDELFGEKDELANEWEKIVYSSNPAERLRHAIFEWKKKGKEKNFIDRQDKRGKTLSHAIAGRNFWPEDWLSIKKLLRVVFRDCKPDFTIPDEEGCTPLHSAMLKSGSRDSWPMIKEYIHYAAQNKVDFLILNGAGFSALHLACIHAHGPVYEVEGWTVWGETLLSYMLKCLSEYGNAIDLDQLSLSGTSSFYEAVAHGKYQEAVDLLEAGACPFGFDCPEKDPLQLIKQLKSNGSCEYQGETCSLKDFEKVREMGIEELRFIQKTMTTLEWLKKRVCKAAKKKQWVHDPVPLSPSFSNEKKKT